MSPEASALAPPVKVPEHAHGYLLTLAEQARARAQQQQHARRSIACCVARAHRATASALQEPSLTRRALRAPRRTLGGRHAPRQLACLRMLRLTASPLDGFVRR